MNHEVCDKLEIAAKSIKEGYVQAVEYFGESEFLIILFGEMVDHLSDAIIALSSAVRAAKDTPSEDMIVLSRALECMCCGEITDGQKAAARIVALRTLFDATRPAADDITPDDAP
jgi:hypothetical protein